MKWKKTHQQQVLSHLKETNIFWDQMMESTKAWVELFRKENNISQEDVR